MVAEVEKMDIDAIIIVTDKINATDNNDTSVAQLDRADVLVVVFDTSGVMFVSLI